MADAAPTKISTSLKRKMSDPTSAENLLECYTKHQKKYMEETNKKWMALSDKMQKTMMELVEKNHENSLLKKQLLAVKEQLEGLKTTCSDLSKQNDTLKKETLACNKKYAQLEIVYDSEFASMSETLTKQKAELLEAANMYAQLKADQDKKHQLVVQLETILLEKDVQLAEMKSQNSQLQADIEQWKATFEQYKVDVTKSNEKIQAELESKVQEQAAKIRQLTEGNELRDAELQIAMANMQKVEDRNVELTKQNLQLSTEMADISKCLDAVKEQNNQMLEGINSQNVKLLDDINSYQKHLAKLVEENKQLKTASGEAAAMAEIKLIAVTNESNELKKKLEEIEKKHLAETTSLLAEKAELNEKLKDITQLHEANVATLELNIKEKETCQTQYEEKLAELERTKNITIAELTYKVNQIKNLSVLPLRLPKITSTNQQDKHSTTTAKPITLNSITPSETSSTNENPQNTLLGAKRRKATKQPPGSLYNTDFNTDSENEEESSDHKHSSSKLPKMNRSAPAKKGLNTFDKLKFSKDP